MQRFIGHFSRATASLLLVILLLPLDVLGDATVQQQGTSSGVAPKTAWTRTLRIKGMKMRVDSTNGSESFLLIYDLDAGKRYRLDEKKRQVFAMDLKEESDRMKGSLRLQLLRKVIKPTGRQLQVAGMPCDEYTYDLQAPASLWHGASVVLHEKGTVCGTQASPVGIDAMNFIHEGLKRGYLFAAYACGSFSSPIGPSFYGDQANVLLLSTTSDSEYEGGLALDVGGMGISHSSMRVTATNSELIPEGVFQIPAGWKLKKEPTPH